MSSTCPTVFVVSVESPGGFKIINASDLKPEHEIWSDEDVSAHKPIMSLQEIAQDELQSDGGQSQSTPAREQGKRGKQSGKPV